MIAVELAIAALAISGLTIGLVVANVVLIVRERRELRRIRESVSTPLLLGRDVVGGTTLWHRNEGERPDGR